MSVLQGILLGLVQGLAEFLPISSSGHLALTQRLLGLSDVPLLYDVFLHVATLCAVVLFFWKKIWALLCAFGRLLARRPAPTQCKNADGSTTILTQEQALAREQNSRRYILAIILTTLVTGVLGLATETLLGDLPARVICIGFIVTALLLIASALVERRTKAAGAPTNRSPTWWQALIIGIAQGIGTLPGISRSGATIAGALFCGVPRSVAGEYSFIASIPAILGAFLLELKDVGKVSQSIGALPVAAGCLAACASGYAALTILMRIIRKGRLEWFACYLIPVGILGLIFLR